MKMFQKMRTKVLLSAVAAVAAVLSCEKQGQLNPGEAAQELQEGITNVEAFLAEAPKTYLGSASGSDYSVCWSDTDAIQINGCNSTSVTVSATDNSKASFEIGGVVDYPYCAVYPASAASDYDSSTGTATVTIPSLQTYTEGSFDPAAGIMLGYAESGAVNFSNAMAYLKVSVSGGSSSAAIKSVRIRGNVKSYSGTFAGRQAMSGDFTATFTDGGCSLASTYSDASSVTLDCGEGVAQGTPMILAIPAQTYDKGINLFVVGADDTWQEIVSSKSFNAQPGVMYNTAVAFNGDGGTYEGVGIYTEMDWNACAFQNTLYGNCNEFKDELDTVNIWNDIVVDRAIMRFGGTTEGLANSTFADNLQGHGHLVSAPMKVPFFTYIAGKVLNLNIGGEKSEFTNSSWGTAMLALRVASGGYVKGVTASCTVTSPASASSAVYYYGMFREIYSGGEVHDCVQKSTFTISAVSGSSSAYVFPFANSNAGLISNCSNEGNVSFTESPGKSIVGPIYKNTGTIEGFVNTGNFDVIASTGGNVSGCVLYGGGYLHNCKNGEDGYSSTKGVLTLTAAPTGNSYSFKVAGIVCHCDGESSSYCGRYYACTNYADCKLEKTTAYNLDRSAMGGIAANLRYGAYGTSETSGTYCTFDGCSNKGHLKFIDRYNGSANLPVFLGGILGCALDATGGTAPGALVFTKPTSQYVSTTEDEAEITVSGKYYKLDSSVTPFNGVYLVIRSNCSNTGTLEMATADASAASTSISGARQAYVGGIAGFTYGIGNSNLTGSSNAHYAVVRGVQNGIIKVGSARTGSICAGGIVGGCCYTKIEQATVTLVDYQATTEQTGNSSGTLAAPAYRGMLGGVVGWVVKHSQIGSSGASAVNAVLTDNTGLNCSASIANQTSLIGYAGITGGTSVHRTNNTEKHELVVYSSPTYNGETVTSSMIYGGGTKTIK